MKKLLIIETEYIGHYLTGYIKYILRALDKKKIKIYILTSKETLKNGKGALKILKGEKVKFKIITIPTLKVSKKDFVSLTLYQLKLYFLIKKNFKSLNNKIKFDHIILTSMQRIDKIISIFGSPFGKIKFSGIFLGLKFHLQNFEIKSESTNHFLSKLLFNRLLRITTLTKIITNDYLLKKYLKNNHWKNQKKVFFLHDPKEFKYKFNKNYALKKLNLKKNKFIILVYGAIIDSKGVEELLQIYKYKIRDVHCLIVGKQFDSTKNFLNKNKFVENLKNNRNISLYNGWQSEKNEAIFFSACDAIWIGYKNYPFPSGVLYQAVSLKKPSIISKEAGFINDLNNKFKIGLSCNIHDPSDILSVIKKLKKSKYSQLIKKNTSKFLFQCNPSIWTKKFQDFIIKTI
ncbi:glycosyltransferase [Candidatus Pelagibacter sp.]|uniref:glycosyltransferase n=1 Tax=Candidatus Pelagibacter sp. TaxID=2024849 RepID=UPI003F849FC8